MNVLCTGNVIRDCHHRQQLHIIWLHGCSYSAYCSCLDFSTFVEPGCFWCYVVYKCRNAQNCAIAHGWGSLLPDSIAVALHNRRNEWNHAPCLTLPQAEKVCFNRNQSSSQPLLCVQCCGSRGFSISIAQSCFILARRIPVSASQPCSSAEEYRNWWKHRFFPCRDLAARLGQRQESAWRLCYIYQIPRTLLDDSGICRNATLVLVNLHIFVAADHDVCLKIELSRNTWLGHQDRLRTHVSCNIFLNREQVDAKRWDSSVQVVQQEGLPQCSCLELMLQECVSRWTPTHPNTTNAKPVAIYHVTRLVFWLHRHRELAVCSQIVAASSMAADLLRVFAKTID